MLKRNILLVVVMVLMFANISSVKGESLMTPPESLRIGLVTNFEYVTTIHFYNSTIVPGFFENETFYGESSITTGGKDFWLSPAKKYYLESDQTYNSYEDAIAISAPLRDSGYKAYPTLIARGTWKVFAGHNDSNSELNQVLSLIDGLYGVTYTQAPSSNERVFMECNDHDPILLENRYGKTVFATLDVRDEVPVIDLGKRSYRGYIEAARYGRDDMTAVNIVKLDDYLYSVVVSEIYAKWPVESIKAQSVAARTFAVFYKEVARKFPNDPFDLDDTVSSQVYKGYSVEDERVNIAVDATSNEMIYFDGRVIPAYFFAASGGRTENSEDVWSGRVPYLKSVPDIYETEPEKRPWTKTLTPEEIEAALSKKSVSVGKVTDIEAIGYTDAGRVLTLRITGSKGSYDLQKETMRYWLGINSRKFVILKNGDAPDFSHPVVSASENVDNITYTNAYVVDSSGEVQKVLDDKDQVIVMGTENIINQPMISGRSGVFILAGAGWGHGAGMSQAGAKGMANAGFTYREILQHYYTNTVVQ